MAKLMLIDDDHFVLGALCECLRAVGHEVETCADPIVALAMMDEINPQLLVVDYELPRIKGTELLAEVRSRPRLRTVPVIFLSGHPPLEYSANVPSDPRVAFLQKPLDAKELIKAVERMINPPPPAR
jgi:DNA-binding NtrC family response regulator